MKTVKELADELGVAKQTINNNRPEDVPFKKINGMNYIDANLEQLIIDNINSKKVKSIKHSKVLKKTDGNTHQKSFKKILELDAQSYAEVEKMLLGMNTSQELLNDKEKENKELRQKLSEYEAIKLKLESIDSLLKEKDERISDLKQDKQNLNVQLAMEQESLQNQQKLSLSQSQKIARLEQENKELNESLRLSYKEQESNNAKTEQRSTEQNEYPKYDPAPTQPEQTKQKGFFSRIFGK